MDGTKAILVDVNFLQTYLENKGISQCQFAEEVGVTQSTVNRIMNGKRNPGGKFVTGVLQGFNDLSFDEVFSCSDNLLK
ncbi:helix-turn-helix transcriptional regulator [Lentibacillus jeotgali]|uniref:helix-turn-helix transcriptional regulator n=1 Tax=Lentibacillus jeotgali TaxID=558169 RepID=UPI0002625C12|nr:helix-turn-helix transcriptional regulator [Lentibacillus jeotgali]